MSWSSLRKHVAGPSREEPWLTYLPGWRNPETNSTLFAPTKAKSLHRHAGISLKARCSSLCSLGVFKEVEFGVYWVASETHPWVQTQDSWMSFRPHTLASSSSGNGTKAWIWWQCPCIWAAWRSCGWASGWLPWCCRTESADLWLKSESQSQPFPVGTSVSAAPELRAACPRAVFRAKGPSTGTLLGWSSWRRGGLDCSPFSSSSSSSFSYPSSYLPPSSSSSSLSHLLPLSHSLSSSFSSSSFPPFKIIFLIIFVIVINIFLYRYINMPLH